MDPESLPKPIQAWISKTLGVKSFHLALLAGDGSSRQFFRVSPPSGASFILINDPDWEQTKDYLVLGRYLLSQGILVPEMRAENPALGVDFVAACFRDLP